MLKNLFIILAAFAILSCNASSAIFSFAPDTSSTFSKPFIHLNNKVLAYSSNNQLFRIDLDANKPTQILKDTINACDANPALHSRLFYHEAQDTLLYYCRGNNSLLILDHDSYVVQGEISGDSQLSTLDQIKIYADGDSVVLLGVGPLWGTAPMVPTRFVKINLAQQITEKAITMNTGLTSGEIVVGYATNGINSYVVTNYHFAWTYTKIYQITFTATGYSLSLFADNRYSFTNPPETPIYFLGPYLVISDKSALYFYDIVTKAYQSMYLIASYQANNIDLQNNLQIGYHRESDPYASRLYAQFTSPSQVKEISVAQNGTIITSYVCDSVRMHYAVGNSNDRDLLFAIAKSNQESSAFNSFYDMAIYDPLTKNFLSANPGDFTKSFQSESNVAVIRTVQSKLQFDVYNTLSGQHLAQLLVPGNYFYDSSSNVLFYVNYASPGASSCSISYFDLENLGTGVAYSISDYIACGNARILHARVAQNASLSDVVLSYQYYKTYVWMNGTRYVMSQFADSVEDLVVPDYENKVFYAIKYSTIYPQASALIIKYVYNNSTQVFDKISTDSQTLANITDSPFTVLDGKTIAGLEGGNKFFTLDVTTNILNSYEAPYALTPASSSGFSDQLGNYYIFLAFAVSGQAAKIWTSHNGFIELPGQDAFSYSPGVAGKCSYWLKGNYNNGLQYANFYNDICL